MKVNRISNSTNFYGQDKIVQNLERAVDSSYKAASSMGGKRILALSETSEHIKKAVTNDAFSDFLNGGYLKLADGLQAKFNNKDNDLTIKAFKDFQEALMNITIKHSKLNEYYTKTKGKLKTVIYTIEPKLFQGTK